MEIREGIKFKSIYASNIEFVLDKIEKNNLISRDNDKYKYTFEDVIANFKKDIWKLTYYPYKIGDWVKILDSIGPAFKITNEMGFDFESPPINIRPAFEDEISKSDKVMSKEDSCYKYIGKSNHEFTNGKIYRLNDGKSISDTGALIDDKGRQNGYYPNNLDYFKAVNKEALQKFEAPEEEVLNKEELLAEAKRRYPIGTRIKCLFEYTDKNAKFATITKDNFYFPNDLNNMWVQGLNWILCVYENGKWAEIIENKTENMNDLDKELKERESKLNKNVTNSDQVLTLNLIASEIFKPNNKIKPNLIKHNNSRFQKLLIIRTNKSKHSGKTK